MQTKIISGRLAPILLLIAQMTHAHCGLNFCPRDAETPQNAFETGLGVHQTGFDVNGHGGQYTEGTAQIQYVHKGQWLLGANLGMAQLNVQGESRWGMENPLLMGEWRFYPGMGNRIVTGLQVELPFGDEEDGIGTDHTMLIPYVSFGKGLDPYFVSATLGFSQAFGGKSSTDTGAAATMAAHAFPYVHPHEDREFLYRAGAGISLWNKKANPEIYISGQSVLVSEKENLPEDENNDLTIGLQFPYNVNARFALLPRVEAAVLKPSRFDWTAGSDFQIRF